MDKTTVGAALFENNGEIMLRAPIGKYKVGIRNIDTDNVRCSALSFCKCSKEDITYITKIKESRN